VWHANCFFVVDDWADTADRVAGSPCDVAIAAYGMGKFPKIGCVLGPRQTMIGAAKRDRMKSGTGTRRKATHRFKFRVQG
jgi:hypothetical protein